MNIKDTASRLRIAQVWSKEIVRQLDRIRHSVDVTTQAVSRLNDFLERLEQDLDKDVPA